MSVCRALSTSVGSSGKTWGWTFWSGAAGTYMALPAQVAIYPYVKSVPILVCPSNSDGHTRGNLYAINGCVVEDPSNDVRPSKVLPCFDGTGGTPDGHVKQMRGSKFRTGGYVIRGTRPPTQGNFTYR